MGSFSQSPLSVSTGSAVLPVFPWLPAIGWRSLRCCGEPQTQAISEGLFCTNQHRLAQRPHAPRPSCGSGSVLLVVCVMGVSSRPQAPPPSPWLSEAQPGLVWAQMEQVTSVVHVQISGQPSPVALPRSRTDPGAWLGPTQPCQQPGAVPEASLAVVLAVLAVAVILILLCAVLLLCFRQRWAESSSMHPLLPGQDMGVYARIGAMRSSRPPSASGGGTQTQVILFEHSSL
ncbi:hypothetical protein COCON_G00164710 [Conger conger]|uniref:Uncharacterized protein n=1 Tax=Conger conger TaxID=82655 RepID=A0A9Q1HTV0_CONCO|nr:hypothetical protein COCON_G00164710 [Conger conger]